MPRGKKSTPTLKAPPAPPSKLTKLKFTGPSGRITVHVMSEPTTFDPYAEVPPSVAEVLVKEKRSVKGTDGNATLVPAFEYVEGPLPKAPTPAPVDDDEEFEDE